MNKYMPTRKITAAGIGIPISIILAWMLNEFADVQMPVEVSTALGGVISTVLGYMVPEKTTPAGE